VNPYNVLLQNAKPVVMLPPKNITGAAQASDVINMQNYGLATIIVSQGDWGGGDAVLTLHACDDNTPSNNEAIPFRYKQAVTGDGSTDNYGDYQESDAAGVTLNVADTTTVIEISNPEVEVAKPGYTHLQVRLSSPGANDDFVSVIGVLTGPTFKGNNPITAID
jgi:hypothetical protein